MMCLIALHATFTTGTGEPHPVMLLTSGGNEAGRGYSSQILAFDARERTTEIWGADIFPIEFIIRG